ncbi:translation initiation factor IF-2-like [Trifolium pratense]|uniref:Uncharacterized protein n=2 Tax=Trifolium pratense TaxID=57577 RepID=A0ACB0JII8_TRIPR|nr:translation initiation factor IF-2-like [Trifolium pratense]CAJ2644924.1 unnamed protein product [Trifolium pratense]
MYLRKKNIVLGTTITSTLYEKYLKVAREHVYGFEPFDFNLSYYCTQEFANWWRQYFYSRHLGDSALISRLESGFTQPQINRIEQQVKPAVAKKQATEALKSLLRSTNTITTETGPSKKLKPSVVIVSEEEEEEEEASFQRKRSQPPVHIETTVPVDIPSYSPSAEERKEKKQERKEKKERKEKRKEEKKKKEERRSSEDRTTEKKKSKSSSGPSETNLDIPSNLDEQREPTPQAEIQEDVVMPDATLDDSNNMPQQDTIPEETISNKSSGDTVKDSEATISEKIMPEPSPDQPEQPESNDTHDKTSPFKEWGKTAPVEVEVCQTSSEEEEFDSEAMKEAEAGGSELLPETSTSKLSASLGLPEEEFIALQRDDPEAALKLLLSKKTPDPVSSSGPSNSTASD